MTLSFLYLVPNCAKPHRRLEDRSKCLRSSIRKYRCTTTHRSPPVSDPRPIFCTTPKLRDSATVDLRKRRTDEAEGVHGRADRVFTATAAIGQAGGGDLP
jgi:hypothetical protein